MIVVLQSAELDWPIHIGMILGVGGGGGEGFVFLSHCEG